MFLKKLSERRRAGAWRAWAWLAFPAAWLSLPLPAAEPVVSAPTAAVTPATATNLALKPLGDGRFELGLVRLDTRTRTISFPASVNLTDTNLNLEYLLVHANGKTHESLLRTDARPQDIQLVFLLLGAKGSGTNALPEDPATPLPGEKIEVELSWQANGKEQRRPAEEFVAYAKTNAPVSHGPWIYTGSRVRDDGFAAQLDGSIISLITDPDALINNPRPGREDDDAWKPRAAGLPPLKSAVEVSIRLSR